MDVPEFVALVRAIGADPIEVFRVFTAKLPYDLTTSSRVFAVGPAIMTAMALKNG